MSRTLREDFVQRIVERANALEPDIVVITGDLFDLPAINDRRGSGTIGTAAVLCITP